MSNVKNLVGMKFNRLTVIERCGSNKEGRALWRCCCECGKVINVTGKNLLNENTRSCGCFQKQRIMEISRKRAKTNINLGDKFGKLTVTNRVPNNKHKQLMYNCLCDCGNKSIVSGYKLKNGYTKSCGCMKKELRNLTSYHEAYRESKGLSKDCMMSNENNILRREFYRLDLRNKCYKRDNYTCVLCHQKGGELQAHHVDCWSVNDKTRYDLNNLVTLCKECHYVKVHGNQWKGEVDKQITQVLKEYLHQFNILVP